ncbi:MAG: hypothetical protein ACR2QE_03790, partial [Acidimicrobiales bacterium]
VVRITTSAPLDPHADRQDLLEELLATVPDAPPELWARACYTAVGSAFEEGSWEKTLPYGEEAIRRFDELGDDSQRAYSQMMLAYCLWGAGRDGVEPLLRAALVSFEALDDTMGEAYICWVLSQWRLHIDPDDDEAEPLSRRSVELFTQVASPFGLAHAREGRGYVLAQQGHLAEAMGQMRQAADGLRAVGHMGCVAHALDGAALVLVLDDRHDEGAQLVGAAERLREETGAGERPWEIAARELCGRALEQELSRSQLESAKARGRARRPETLFDDVGLLLADDRFHEPADDG